MSTIVNHSLRYTFPKAERLHSKKLIQELFDKGSSFYLYPFKVFYLPSGQVSQSQVLFSVSKRNFKNAVDRNQIKRLMREAYRLNKHDLVHEIDGDAHYLFAYIYTGKDILSFQKLEQKLKKTIFRLKKELSPTTE